MENREQSPFSVANVLARTEERKSQIIAHFPGAGLEGIYTSVYLCICPEGLTLSGEVRSLITCDLRSHALASTAVRK